MYATLLAFAVGVARVPLPFYPRHLTVVSSLTIGTPAFFLALAPNQRRARPGFIGRVLRFAVPAGVVAAAATFGAYALTRATAARRLLVGSMGAAFRLALAVPALRRFSEFDPPSRAVSFWAVAVAAALALEGVGDSPAGMWIGQVWTGQVGNIPPRGKVEP